MGVSIGRFGRRRACCSQRPPVTHLSERKAPPAVHHLGSIGYPAAGFVEVACEFAEGGASLGRKWPSAYTPVALRSLMDQTDRIRRHFDQLADGEWERLDANPRTRVTFEVHRRFLAEFVSAGDRVLEIGAGPGRVTIALAALGAREVVNDISEVQLALNRQHVSEAGVEEAVEARYLLDIRDTARFSADEFDVVLAYGGPLSYVFEEAGDALGDLLRIGRVVVASVMSTVGVWAFFLPQVMAQVPDIGVAADDAIFETGDLRHEGRSEGHTCQMYRWREVEALIRAAGGEVVSASASNWASLAHEETLAQLVQDPAEWRRFIDHEVSACREPGLLDAGTHILFAARRVA
jgi:SAM-dependent methyltransferase